MTTVPPTGAVTFFFTDIEGSTRLWEKYPESMAVALARHDEELRRIIEGAGGYINKTVGDAFCAAFASAGNGIEAAYRIQRLLEREEPILVCDTQGNPVGRIRVRIALHTGVAQARDNDYFGPPVNRVARILSTGHGGQTLLSAAVREKLEKEDRAGDALNAALSFLSHGSHRLKDMAEPEALFQLVHPDLPSEFPPLRSLSSHPNNLPTQTSSFVGRRREMEAVRELLAGADARLVTLTGPGGSGKTRIALQAAADRIEAYPGGAWWVDLAPLRDAELVIPAIAAALGIKEEAGPGLLLAAAERLREGAALLVLDNFEQVMEAAPNVADLLSSCPDLRILVTSRAVLNLSAEHEYAVPGLDSEEAVVLFSTRAQQVRAGFALDGTTRPIIERLCQRLDGIPLAIELAAAQVRMLTPAQIEKQLAQRFRVLVSPFRDAQARQRTLRAAVDWSYDLLSDEEKRLFAQLSVFVGGFTLEAAEAVCPEEDVFFGAARLREQSLLHVVVDEDDEEADALTLRFRLLETLREYGQEKLAESGNHEAVAARHARFFAGAVVERLSARSGALTPEDEETLSALSRDRENLRAALEWLLAHGGDVGEAAAMAAAMCLLWERQGRFREGREYLARCLARESEISDRRLRAALQRKAGWFAYRQHDYAAAREHAERELELGGELGDREHQCTALNDLALIAQEQERYAEARDLFERSLEIARSLGDEMKQAARLSNLGLLEIHEGDHAQADVHLREAYALYERGSDTQGAAACLVNLSELALRREDWDEADRLAGESLEQFRRLGDQPGVAFSLANRAEAADGRGDNDLALAYIDEAQAVCKETGMDWLTETLETRRTHINRHPANGEEQPPGR